MAVTYAEFVGDPLFASIFGGAKEPNYPEAYVTQLLALASTDVKLCRYLGKQSIAIKYLVAHRLVMFERAGILGVGGTATATPSASSGELEKLISPGSTISSLSVAQGSNSASFSPATQSGEKESALGGVAGEAESLSSTLWGQMFLSIKLVGSIVGFVP